MGIILYSILSFCLGFGTCFVLIFFLSLRFRGDDKAELMKDINELSRANIKQPI